MAATIVFRKKTSPIFILIFCAIFSISASSFSLAQPIKNGVKCNKIGVLSKAGAVTYRCSNNPLIDNGKKTWTAMKCVSGLRLLSNSKQQYEDWEDLAKLAGNEGQKTIDELAQSIVSLELELKNGVCKRGK